MGVPTSEVGYTPAMPRREDHEVHKDIGPKKKCYVYIIPNRMTQINIYIF